MAEKSLPNPAISFPPAVAVGVVSVTDVVPMVVGINVAPWPHPLGVGTAEVLEAVSEDATDVAGGTVTFPLREGGTMATVSSLGISFFRTFSAMRYMARANCSAFSFPFFSMSHRFLERAEVGTEEGEENGK